MVLSLTIDPATPATAHLGTYHGGVYKSTDGGENWRALKSKLGDTSVSVLAIRPLTPFTLLAGSGNGSKTEACMYLGTHGNEDWMVVSLGCMVLDIAFDPVTPSNVYAGVLAGLGKSKDGGLTWKLAPMAKPGWTEPEVYALAVDPAAPATLYAGTYAGDVYKTTDSGASWQAVNVVPMSNDGRIGILALAIDPATPSTLYAGTYQGVFKSTDSAKSWQKAGAGLPTSGVSAIAINPAMPATLYIGIVGGGVFKSTDSGETWSAFNAGLTTNNIQTLVFGPETPAILYAGTDDGVFAIRQTK
jgi:photosystem II stability/assembly factor-like uncharacterized protein